MARQTVADAPRPQRLTTLLRLRSLAMRSQPGR